jgi:hypothetical protein
VGTLAEMKLTDLHPNSPSDTLPPDSSAGVRVAILLFLGLISTSGPLFSLSLCPECPPQLLVCLATQDSASTQMSPVNGCPAHSLRPASPCTTHCSSAFIHALGMHLVLKTVTIAPSLRLKGECRRLCLL